jgi:amino acid transporter
MELNVWYGIFFGGLLAFYAYIGFEDMVNVAEEVKNPHQNMPTAILIALSVSALIYILVAVVAVMSVDPRILAISDAPLAYIYEQNTGNKPVVITLIGMFAIINGALIQIIMASRILYGLSRQGWLHARLGDVHPITRTPLLATLLTCAIVLLFALTSTVEKLAENTSFVILIVFALVNLSLLRIKHRESRAGEVVAKGIRVVPYWVPVAGLISSTGFVMFRLYNFFGGA